MAGTNGNLFILSTDGRLFRGREDDSLSWVQLPTSFVLSSLAVAPNGDLYAARASGWTDSLGLFSRSTDQGTTWFDWGKKDPQLGYLGFSAASTVLISQTTATIFAVSPYREIFRSSDLGYTWQSVDHRNLPYHLAWIAVGKNGDFFWEIFGGPAGGYGVYRLSDTTATPAGAQAITGGALYTYDPLFSYSMESVLESSKYIYLALSPGRGGIVRAPIDTPGLIPGLQDSSWSAPNAGLTDVTVTAMGLDSLENVYLATTGGVFVSTNSGERWHEIQGGPQDSGAIGLLSTRSNLIFAVTDSGQIYRSLYPASNHPWTTVEVPAASALAWTGAQLVGGAPVTGLTAEGRMTYASNTGSYFHLYQTFDGGESWGWTGITSSSYGMYAEAIALQPPFVYVCSKQFLWQFGIGPSYYTPYTAKFYSLKSTGSFQDIAVSQQTILVADKDSVFQTTDAGSSWTMVKQNDLRGRCEHVVLWGGRVAFVAGGDSSTGGMLRSLDHGQTWQLASTGFPDKGFSALALSGSVVYAGTAGGNIYRTTDLGAAWQAITSGVMGSAPIMTISARGHGVLAGTTNGVYFSTDMGDHWQAYATGLESDTISRVALTDSLAFAGTTSGLVYRRLVYGLFDTTTVLDIAAVGVDRATTDLLVPVTFALKQNYPNPFNPSTIIHYTVGGAGIRGPGAS